MSKIEIIGAQDEQIFIEFSTKQLAGLGIDRAALIAAVQAQNSVNPAGSVQTSDEKLSLQVSGSFRSEQDILNVNFLSNGRMIRLRDIAEVRRSYADPPQPMFRVNGQPAIGLAISMRNGGDILALGRNVSQEIDDARNDLPLGIEATLVSDQPAVVDSAIGEFMVSLLQAIAIIMAVSIISLGISTRGHRRASIPLTLAIVFPIMEGFGIDLQRISLGALIIALSLLVDSAMTTVDVMTTRIAQGDTTENAASFAYKTLAFPMLTGTFVTVGGLRAHRLRAKRGGRIHLLDLRRRDHRVVRLVVRRCPLRAVAWRGDARRSRRQRRRPQPGWSSGCSVSLLVGAMRVRWITIGVTLACLVAAFLVSPFVQRQFFPASDRPELVVDLTLPQNASIYASDAAATQLDALLKGDPDVDRWSTYIGRGAIRFYLPLDVKLPNDFFAQAVVVAKDIAARERLHAKLEKALSDRSRASSPVCRRSNSGLRWDGRCSTG